MSDTRLYALLTAAALVAGLVIVVVPDADTAGADMAPSPGTAVALATSVTTAPPTTTSSFTAAMTPPLVQAVASSTTTLPRVTTTTVSPPPLSASSNKSGSGSSGGATTNTTTAPPVTSPPTTVVAEFRPDMESSFSSKINGLRSSNGLAALTRSGSLDAEARSWAKNMASAGKLKHSNIGRLVPPWAAAGENVGKGASVRGVFNLLAGSGGHRANMLGDYTHMGVGVWIDSSGRIWTTHIFTR